MRIYDRMYPCIMTLMPLAWSVCNGDDGTNQLCFSIQVVPLPTPTSMTAGDITIVYPPLTDSLHSRCVPTFQCGHLEQCT